MPKQPLALARRALAAILIIAIGPVGPLAAAPAAAQLSLPTLGDGSDLTPSEERRLGDRIIRELYRDPDYIDDPVLVEYVQTLWQSLLAASRARGELSPELEERFAWEVLLGRDRTLHTSLSAFVRSLVGLDREAAAQAFAHLIASGTASASQLQFINEIVQHLTEHGAMPAERLYASPFTDIHTQGPNGVFDAANVEQLFVALQGLELQQAMA